MIPQKKNPKKQLENYSKIFLQIGLVLVLFVTHLIIENVVAEKVTTPDKSYEPLPFTYDYEPLPFERYKEPPKQVAQQQPKQKVVLDIIKKGNPPKPTLNSLTVEMKPLPPSNQPVSSSNTKTEEEPPELPKTTYDYKMATPLFKGCKDISKTENRACFDRKMKRFVQKKFNAEIAEGLNLRRGNHKIFVQFIINEQGDVVDINVRAPHPKLHKEVQGMIQKLPQFTPGKVGGENVKVKYLLPINFKVD
uniref:TonB C-terminal domain-containing protein n=1 Tax=Leptocylindrus danicus TaxID=163516 RepID=A0A7S2NXP5_9STRA|mmetsp:Transcript_17869/g.26613  ORF Transcript_17869/g.26613 Transcript_17869/m.26613 type:complete len:249 (+) Transcript_17869:29-775(+)